MAWKQAGRKATILSEHINQFYRLVTGSSIEPATFGNNNTYTGLSAWSRNGGSLISVLGIDNETVYAHQGLANGLTSVTAELTKPAVNMQVELKPNGAGAFTTGSTYFFRSRRHGSGAGWSSATADNGSAAAHYSFLSMAQSNSTYNTDVTATAGHDEVALAGICVISGVNDDRGGTVLSVGRGWGHYSESVNYSTEGQAIGSEIKIVNNMGTAAALHTDTGYKKKNVVLQLVSAVDEITVGGTWDLAHGASTHNAMYCRITSGGVKDAACYAGFYYENNAVRYYIHDAKDALWNGAAVPFARLANNMPVVALAPDLTDNLMFKIHPSGFMDYYLPNSTTTNNDIRWLLQSGTQVMGMSPGGILDFKDTTTASTAAMWTVAGTGTTAFRVAFTPGGTGQPAANLITDWLRVKRDGALRMIPCLT